MSGALTGEELERRLFWQFASPFVRILGVTLDGLDGDCATMRVRLLPRLAAAASDVIDPLVAPGLIDDCLSLAIGQVLPPVRGIATLDLWFRTVRDPGAGDLVATARRIAIAGAVASSIVEVRDDEGVVMHGGGSFVVGHYPSGTTGDPDRAGRYDPGALPGRFRAAIGLQPVENGFSLAGSDAVIGWEAGPIIHGGAVAAALMAAAEKRAPEGQRVSSMTVRYLRPAPHQGLIANARIDRAARRASHLSVAARVQGRIVATATAVTA